MSVVDKTVFIFSMAGFIRILHYWLLKNVTIFIIFWVFCPPTIASLPLFWCKRRKNFSCCLNSVSEELRYDHHIHSCVT